MNTLLFRLSIALVFMYLIISACVSINKLAEYSDGWDDAQEWITTFGINIGTDASITAFRCYFDLPNNSQFPDHLLTPYQRGALNAFRKEMN